MSDYLTTRFDAAAEDVKTLPERPDNDILLRLYALYKQATVGDVEGKPPGFLDLAGRMKHNAWAELEGTSSEDAMQQYVDLVEQLRTGA
jgi:diazepam-binding inhibitor (GABA receptor modulator, acyl-CoA-binding protein)